MKFREFEFPEQLYYNDDYSWVRLDGDTAIVGVSDFGAKLVKQFVFVELPKKGKEIKKGDVYV
ncbi:glycine cleavage system protein H, partial [Candidatus Woesearchaeota archaeon ex4484_78]